MQVSNGLFHHDRVETIALYPLKCFREIKREKMECEGVHLPTEKGNIISSQKVKTLCPLVKTRHKYSVLIWFKETLGTLAYCDRDA